MGYKLPEVPFKIKRRLGMPPIEIQLTQKSGSSPWLTLSLSEFTYDEVKPGAAHVPYELGIMNPPGTVVNNYFSITY